MKNECNLVILRIKSSDIVWDDILWTNQVMNEFGSEYYVVMRHYHHLGYFSIIDRGIYMDVSFMFNRLLANLVIIDAICDYIFTQWRLCQKIAIYLLDTDILGKFLMNGAGFTQEVVFRSHYCLQGAKHDCLVYSKYHTVK